MDTKFGTKFRRVTLSGPAYRTPETQEQSLTLALYLGLVAPDDAKAQAAAMLAEADQECGVEDTRWELRFADDMR